MSTQIGQRIRRMREAQGLSHDEVATLSGVPAARLAEFEDGHGIPSVGIIIKLSRVLGSRVEGILHGGATLPHPLTVCRAGDVGTADEEQEDTEQGYRFRSLGRLGSPGQAMEPLLITFDPGRCTSPPVAHDGQEFVYVIDGSVELLHDGERITLGPGDSAYIDATRPHLFRTVGDRPSRAVGVVWSPS